MKLVATYTKAKPIYSNMKVFDLKTPLEDVWRWAKDIDCGNLSFALDELLACSLYGTLTIQFLEEQDETKRSLNT